MICGTLRQTVKSAAASVLREHRVVRGALLRAAAARGRSLVLCYHTVAPAHGVSAVVPTIHPDHFTEQMLTLKAIGDIVPLDWLLQRRAPSSRPMFAVTFDDDDPTHVRNVLPILRTQQIPATFFLSGRSLHGLGPYWWTRLERSVETIGLGATCDALEEHAPTLKELIRRCRNLGVVKDLQIRDTAPPLSASDIRLLSDAGMTIGFHTLRHPCLTRLNDRDLEDALTLGRDALAEAAGRTIKLFAYPYGTVDRRVAAAVRTAEYAAALALGNRPFSGQSDRYCIPRWQPGSVAVRDFSGDVTVRLSQRVSQFARVAR